MGLWFLFWVSENRKSNKSKVTIGAKWCEVLQKEPNTPCYFKNPVQMLAALKIDRWSAGAHEMGQGNIFDFERLSLLVSKYLSMYSLACFKMLQASISGSALVWKPCFPISAPGTRSGHLMGAPWVPGQPTENRQDVAQGRQYARSAAWSFHAIPPDFTVAEKEVRSQSRFLGGASFLQPPTSSVKDYVSASQLTLLALIKSLFFEMLLASFQQISRRFCLRSQNA